MKTVVENPELRKLWEVQLEILDVIDKICKNNEIHYSLYAGSLLGAVRHKGFIPWDDDLDVCMSREGYELFIKAWENEDHAGFVLQNKDNTPSFTQSFTKIRKDHTTFLQYDWEKDKYHTGIFVDVFPIDRIPSRFLNREIFYWNCMKYQLYTREFVPPRGSAVVKFVSKMILDSTDETQRNTFRKRFENKLKEYDKHSEWNTVAIERIQTIAQPLPTDLLDRYIRLEFEKKQYECFAKWHEYLTCKFGDYMKLPPENERVLNHHQLIIDFEHNYEELEHE